MNRHQEQTGYSVRQRMSAPEKLFHTFMLMCTCGIWYPVYAARRDSIRRVTKHYR